MSENVERKAGEALAEARVSAAPKVVRLGQTVALQFIGPKCGSEVLVNLDVLADMMQPKEKQVMLDWCRDWCG